MCVASRRLEVFIGFDANAAADPAILVDVARAAGLDAETQPKISAALEAAPSGEGPPPHVVICGSLYLADEVLALNSETRPT
jgi:dihydrofolate synthase/folylpolyglutamate synthase